MMQMKWIVSLLVAVCLNGGVSNDNRDLSIRNLMAATAQGLTGSTGIIQEQGSPNRLPQNFYGNYPGKGVVEVSGKAGDIFRKDSLPKLDIRYTVDYWMVFRFEEDVRNFRSTNETTYGFYMETVSNGVVERIDFRLRGKALTDCFDYDQKTKTYVPKYSENKTMAYRTFELLPDEDGSYHSFAVVFKNPAKISLFHLYYDEVPRKITNVIVNNLPRRSLFNTDDNRYSGTDKDTLPKPSYYEGTRLNFNLNYGECLTKDYLIEKFIAMTGYDGLESWIDVEDKDNYFSVGKSAPLGNLYTIRLSGEDKTKEFRFKIVDEIGPEIFPSYPFSKIETSYDNLKESSTFIRNHFFVKDNYDTDLTLEVKTLSGDVLKGDSLYEGACYAVCKDQSGNESSYIFALQAKDLVGPKITQSISEINTTPSKKIEEVQLLSYFYAEDEIDGPVDVKPFANDYSENYYKIGEYAYTVQAQDLKGNLSYATILIHVRDGSVPVWSGNETSFTFVFGNLPPIEEVIDSLIRQGILDDKEYPEWEQLSGDFYDQNLSVGLHEMEFRFYCEDGESKDVTLSIKVIDGEKEATEEEEKAMSFWERLCKWWVDLWASIVRFFTGK